MVPETCPASEFHPTWSPTENSLAMIPPRRHGCSASIQARRDQERNRSARLGAAGLCGSVGGQVDDEGVDEGFAGGDLLEFDELVGCVGLGDVPGPADDGR